MAFHAAGRDYRIEWLWFIGSGSHDYDDGTAQFMLLILPIGRRMPNSRERLKFSSGHIYCRPGHCGGSIFRYAAIERCDAFRPRTSSKTQQGAMKLLFRCDCADVSCGRKAYDGKTMLYRVTGQGCLALVGDCLPHKYYECLGDMILFRHAMPPGILPQ